MDKKLKKEHKHRQHHRNEKDDDDQRESRKLPPSKSSSSSSSYIPVSSSDRQREEQDPAKPKSLMDELRQKRLQREKQERKRANILLANVDIFGAGPQQHHSEEDAASNSHQYHQQFHPHLLKDKKQFGLNTKR